MAEAGELVTEACPNCTVVYVPDPSVGDGKPQCPVCVTRSESERVFGQLLALIKTKRDSRATQKQRRQGIVLVDSNGRPKG